MIESASPRIPEVAATKASRFLGGEKLYLMNGRSKYVDAMWWI
jgi:hypothetical protein